MENYVFGKHEYGWMLGLLAPLAALGCGGSAPPSDTPEQAAPPTAAATSESGAAQPATADRTIAEPVAPAKPFREMSPPERLELMKTKVTPQMAEVFAAFDPKEFDEVRCTTCHGPGAKSGDFEMPTKSLPALDREEMEEHPEMTKFMMEQVVPKMAAILGEAPYNPETHQGFGCFDCHTQKGK